MPVWWIALACTGTGADAGPGPGPGAGSDSEAGQAPAAAAVDVVAVRATGDAGAYTLFVTLASDETGCGQYADWWEVVDPSGELRYRRVLTHSHPDDQPFERSGGPVPIAADEEVVVRGHLHVDGGGGGYVGEALRGTVAGGFAPWADAPEGFAAGLASDPPLPEGCLF
jgi:hypothetical protein